MKPNPYTAEYQNLSLPSLRGELDIVVTMRRSYQQELDEWIEVGNEDQSAKYARRVAAYNNRIVAIDNLIHSASIDPSGWRY